MNRIGCQVVNFNGKSWQLDYTQSSYVRLHLRNLPYEFFTVLAQHKHRPDLVALDALGDPSCWWIICFYNGIINPLKELTSGVVLRIPDKTSVETLLSTAKQVSRIGERITL